MRISVSVTVTAPLSTGLTKREEMLLLFLLQIPAPAPSTSTQGWISFLLFNFGAPAALLLAGMYGGHKGWWCWRRELVREQEVSARDRLDFETRIGVERKEKEMWRDLALQQHHVLQKSVETTKTATEKLVVPTPGGH
jgi:hypothetical protein